ncbi:MAG: hypothetical protein E7490_00020 [Ruminococcaceae bacterium]|nr:hypothetical protein [Oscillospiraceae bacterium]
MIKKTRNKTLASIVTAVYILATMTACSSSSNSGDLSSDTITTTTTVTQVQTPAPETTTTATTTTVAEVITTTEKQTESTTETSETPAPETTTPVPETTTTVQTTTTKPETTTTAQTTTSKPQTEVPAPEEVVEKLNKKMYAIGAVCSYEKNTIRFSDPVNKYHMNDEVVVVEKVEGMYNGKGCDEGYFYKLDDGYYVPAGMFTDNKNWQAETTFQTYDWNPDNPAIPDLPPSDQFVGDLFD